MEEFDDVRNQTVLNLPEYVSSLHLAEDGCTLVAGSATVNHDIFAPVYIIDLETQTLKFRMNHHTRGIQGVRISGSGKYILSYGNCKDSRIAIWREGTLLFATQEVNQMNEAKWRPERIAVPHSQNKFEEEFSIGGKNRLTVWRYHEDINKAIIKSEKSFSRSGSPVDVTSLEYVKNITDGWQLLLGLSSGTLIFFDIENNVALAEYSISLKEVSVIKYSLKNDKVVVATMGGEVYNWRFNVSGATGLDMDSDTRKMKLEAGVINVDLDPDFSEGVASTIDGQISFITLNNSKYANFIQGVDSHNLISQVLKIGEKAILTIHHLGDAKLWNAQTGEILKELKWKEMITYAIFVEEKNKIVFFLMNHDLITMPLDDFHKVRLYSNNNLNLVQDGYMENYVVRGIALPMEEQKRYLFSTYKGVTMATDFLGDDVGFL
jgi:WD40 repeat protein